MAGALDHHLHAVLPGDLGQLAQGLQLGELGRVVGVGDAAGAQAVAQRERDVVGPHDLADVLEVLVEEVLLWWARHHLAMIEPPRETMPVTRLAVSGT